MPYTPKTENPELSRRIMRRVRLVYGLRMLLHPRLLKAAIAIVFFARSTAYISYTSVIANAPSLFELERNIAFAWDAVRHTEVTALALLSGVIAVTLWLVIDVSRRAHASESYL
jgi:hypothetical protein